MSKTCYKNEVPTVGIAGSSAEILSSVWSNEPQAVSLVDVAPKQTKTPESGTQETRYKLHNFVVIVSSITRLTQTVKNLQTSPWWNHMASFLIIDESSPHDQGCSNAFKILSTAWKMNLLHAKVICHIESNGSLIYSYNPYTNQAPLPWQLVKTYRIKKNHPWTLLVQGYHNSQEICKNLDFDKTKDLGGYETRLSSFSVRFDKNWSDTNLKTISSVNGILLQYMFHALNSSVKIFAEPPNSNFNLTSSGFADMSFDAWYFENNSNALMTYPHGDFVLTYMVQHRGRLSQLGKLLHVLDNSSRYAVVFVVFVTFVMMKFFFRQSVSSAILSIVRLICNAAIPNLPINVSARIYFSGLFVFSITLQGIYQGQLASLLTKQVNLPDVNTLEDLENLNYTVYGYEHLIPYLKNTDFSGKIVPLESFGCEKYVLKDAGAACLQEWSALVNLANEYDLHVSNDIIVKILVAYRIREDWPLEEKLNTVILRLIEANIFVQISRKKIDEMFERIKYNVKLNEKQKFQVLTLKELAFAFAILGTGLACSTVIFIVEILMR